MDPQQFADDTKLSDVSGMLILGGNYMKSLWLGILELWDGVVGAAQKSGVGVVTDSGAHGQIQLCCLAQGDTRLAWGLHV